MRAEISLYNYSLSSSHNKISKDAGKNRDYSLVTEYKGIYYITTYK